MQSVAAVFKRSTMLCLLMNGFLLLSVIGIIAGDTLPKPIVYIPQGIESVNGSNIDMMCSHGENCLLDGHSPYINTSLVNWASNLVTVRKNINVVIYDRVVLTFAFDESVALAAVEVDFFLCPQWGIHAPYLTLYGSNSSEFIVYPPGSTNSDFISHYDPAQKCGCQSLSTVRIPVERGEPAHPFWHIVVSFPPPYQDIEWVHVGEVKFVLRPLNSRDANDDDDGNDGPTTSCLQHGQDPDNIIIPLITNAPIPTKNSTIYVPNPTIQSTTIVPMPTTQLSTNLPIQTVQSTTNVPNPTVQLLTTNLQSPTKQITTNISNLFTKTNFPNPTVQMSIKPTVATSRSSMPSKNIPTNLPHNSSNNDTFFTSAMNPSISQTAVSTLSIYQSTINSFTTVYSAFVTTLSKSTKSVLDSTRLTSLIPTSSKSPNPTTQYKSPPQSSLPPITTVILSTEVPQSSLPLTTTSILSTDLPQSSLPLNTTAILSTDLPQSSLPLNTTAILSTAVPHSSGPAITTAILSTEVPQSSGPAITTAILSTAVPHSSGPAITTAILSTEVPQSSGPAITTAVLSTEVPQSSGPAITTATEVPHSYGPAITTAILSTEVPHSSGPAITTAVSQSSGPAITTAVSQSSGPAITTAILSTEVPHSSGPAITTAVSQSSRPAITTAVSQSSGPAITTAILSTEVPHVTTDMLAPPSSMTSSIIKPSSTIFLRSGPNPSIPPNPTLSTVLDSESDHFIGTSISYTQETQSISNNNNGVPPTNTKAENVTPLITSHTTLRPPDIGFPDISGIDNDEQTRKNEVPLLLIVAIAVLIGLCLLVLVALLIMGARLRQRERVKLLTTFPSNGPQISAYNPLYVSPSVIAETMFNDSISHLDLAGEHDFDVKNVVNDASLLQLSPVVHSSNDSS